MTPERGLLEDGNDQRLWFRKSLVILLVVLACLSFTAAVPGVWAQRNLLDTDRFVSRVGPLVDESEVQDALTQRLTMQLMMLIDPQDLFEEVLPERGRLLAAPLAGVVEGFVRDRVEVFVASDAFGELWQASARIAHEASVSLLRGRSGDVLTIDAGQASLNLLPVIHALLREIDSVAPEILGRQVDIPDLSVEEAPTTAIARLEAALDVELADDFGQIAVYDEDTLAAAQAGVRAFDRAVVVLLPLSVLLAGLALWMSPRRRRTVLQLAGGVAFGMVLIRRVAFGLEDDVAGLPPTQAGESAVAVALDVFVAPLTTFASWSLAVAASVIVAAVLTGDDRWVVSLRRKVVGLARSASGTAGDRAQDESTVAWISANRDALLVGGAIAGLVLLWIADLSWLGLLSVLGLIALYTTVVHRVGTPGEPSKPVQPTR